MKKIAILYICTGRYNTFFEKFYESSEKYLFCDTQYTKRYFVWTDNYEITKGKENVYTIHKECEGFPADSLFKFEMFLNIEEELRLFDYIYFFNANTYFLSHVDKEILPDSSGLAMGVWPGKREHQHSMLYPYERNKKSTAYVAPYGDNYIYYMGGINGGKSEEYIKMIRTLAYNIRDDFNRGIIAKFHDESHINAYMRTRKCKKIGREFCWPEEWETKDFTPKIILRNKVNVNSYFNKNRKHTPLATISKGCMVLWNILRWYLKF